MRFHRNSIAPMFKITAVVTLLGLALAAPATAQAPTLEWRVATLEFDLQVANSKISALEERASELKDQLGEAETALSRASLVTNCLDVVPMAVSKRANGDLYLTRRRGESRVWVALVDRSCVRKARTPDLLWRGQKRP